MAVVRPWVVACPFAVRVSDFCSRNLESWDSVANRERKPSYGSGGSPNWRSSLALSTASLSFTLSRPVNTSTESFASYAPRLFSFCDETLTQLEGEHPPLCRPFPGSPFSSLSFNFGPSACTFPHRDYRNLSWGWCSVTSFGDYDYTKGGHLILWDFKIAVEFPPHSTIFIPSAILEHSNTAIRPGERRSSITQYNSAGLFRWVAYGFVPKWVAEEFGVEPQEWWSRPKNRFLNVKSLQ